MSKNTKAAIIGYGDLGVQIINLLSQNGYSIDNTIFFDDNAFNKEVTNSYRFSDYLANEFSKFEFYLGIGYKHLELRNEIFENLHKLGRKTPNLIHSSCIIDDTCEIGLANTLYPGCILDYKASLGNANLLNLGVILSHHSRVEDACFLSPGVCVSGFSKIESNCFLGSRTVVSNHITIGKGSKIGVGSCINKSIPDNTIAIGNPLKIKNCLDVK